MQHALLVLLLIAGFSQAVAAAPPPCLTTPIQDQAIRDLATRLGAFKSPPGPIGCLISRERRHSDGDGIYVDFFNGQIATTTRAQQHFALAAYADATGIQVVWGDTAPYQYDLFRVRYQPDTASDDNCDEGGPCQVEVPRNGFPATFHVDLQGSGGVRYSITVEGCDRVLFAIICKEGWANAVAVDYRLMDFSSLDPVTRFQDVNKDRLQRALIAARRLCQEPIPQTLDEGFTSILLAKLFLIHRKELCPGANSVDDEQILVNAQLLKAEQTTHVGTNLGDDLGARLLSMGVLAAFAALVALIPIVWLVLPARIKALVPFVFGPWSFLFIGVFVATFIVFLATCEKGDYDMAAKGLVRILYEYPSLLKPSYNRVLDDLLEPDLSGGVSRIRKLAELCDLPLPLVEETENHTLMTESTRFLVNGLLVRRARALLQPVPQQYDNGANGMREWILLRLQKFLQDDFFEYNSRPYQRLTVAAIQNLYDYAGTTGDPGDKLVSKAARNVLDYLAAKYAVSSSSLRRHAPFRRLEERASYTPLLGYWSDEETWRFLLLAGGSTVLHREQYDRVNAGASTTMIQAATGNYRVPDLVMDMIVGRKPRYFQRFHHGGAGVGNQRGVEVYVGDPKYLLSAGGNYDVGNRFFFLTFNEAPRLPTTLMPTEGTTDRRELVRIESPRDANTCVAPGFACGDAPTVPLSIPSACIKKTGKWMFINLASTAANCGLNYGLVVAVFADNDAGEAIGFFEVSDAVETPGADPFDQFINGVLARNGNIVLRASLPNVYNTQDARRITFVPVTGSKWKSGIVSIDSVVLNTPQPLDIGRWRLANGPDDPQTRESQWIIQSGVDKKEREIGCVVVQNRLLDQKLILDLSDWRLPRRALVSMSDQNQRECRCPLEALPEDTCPEDPEG